MSTYSLGLNARLVVITSSLRRFASSIFLACSARNPLPHGHVRGSGNRCFSVHSLMSNEACPSSSIAVRRAVSSASVVFKLVSSRSARCELREGGVGFALNDGPEDIRVGSGFLACDFMDGLVPLAAVEERAARAVPPAVGDDSDEIDWVGCESRTSSFFYAREHVFQSQSFSKMSLSSMIGLDLSGKKSGPPCVFVSLMSMRSTLMAVP